MLGTACLCSSRRLVLSVVALSDAGQIASRPRQADHQAACHRITRANGDASAVAVKSLGTAVLRLGVAEPDDFADAFAAMDREQPDSILMVADALTIRL
jgi:hypothetical protein